jgi:hypothetical protein
MNVVQYMQPSFLGYRGCTLEYHTKSLRGIMHEIDSDIFGGRKKERQRAGPSICKEGHCG